MVGRSLADDASVPLKATPPGARVRPVLVVEPNGKTRSIIQTVLGRKGFQVMLAGSADEGLRQIESEPVAPELVVAEAKLDGSDGFSLCSRLRAHERTAQVPIILMSSYSGAQQEEWATQAGADDFVAKPTFARDLLSLVQLRAGSTFGETNFRENTIDLPLPILLRALLAGVRSGRIELFDPPAQVTFRHGGVVDAYFGRTRGAEALVPMLLLGDGEYSVSFTRTLVKGSFYLSLKEIYSTVLPALRRWQQFADGDASLSPRLVVDFVALRGALSEIPETAYEVIRQFDGHRTIRQCILDCELPESTSLAVIWRLYKMGVLVKPTEQPRVPRHGSRGRGSFLESIGPAGSEHSGKTSQYQNLQQLLMLDETPRLAPAATPLRSAVQIGLAIVAVVGIAAGAGWVVSRGDAPKFLGRPSAAQSHPESGQSDSAQLVSAQSTPRTELQDAVGLLESGQKGEAVQLLTRVLQSNPSTGGWFLLGLAKFESGDTEGARQAALETLKLNSRHGRARMLLAAIYLDADEPALAFEELQRYLEFEPNGPYAAQARQLLASQ
jgi:CheY-like chemotaxis protein/Flp pilus assembly protein TadD